MLDPHKLDRYAYLERSLVETLGAIGFMIRDLEAMRGKIRAAIKDVYELRQETENGETNNEVSQDTVGEATPREAAPHMAIYSHRYPE